MKTNLLRLCRRSRIGGLCFNLTDTGQMQPILFSIRNRFGNPEFRIEGVSKGRACWWRFNMSDAAQRKQAKHMLAIMLYCRAAGVKSPACKAWEKS